MKRIVVALSLCFCLIFSLLLPGCGNTLTRYQYTYLDVFDTATTLVVYAPSQSRADEWAKALHARLSEFHWLYTIYESEAGLNNLKTVNDSAGTPVAVDEEIVSLLKLGKKAHTLTGGKVNIAMGSVLSLWHQARTDGIDHPETAALPERSALQKAKQHTDINTLTIDETALTVELSDPESKLDVGAIAKGFAARKVAAFAKELGISSALISVGGNVVAVGGRPDNTPFVIGIEDPSGEQSYLFTVKVRDLAVVTSGNYQRYYTVDGVRYHHLIDPDTLYPAEYMTSVSVIGPDSGLADALSTALFLLPPEEGKALIKKVAGYEAVWILKDGSRLYSDNFEQYTTS